MVVRTQLGDWMESERLAKNLTKGKISELIGISVGQYSAYVSGKSLPRAKTLERIAKAYKKPLSEINSMLLPVVANTPVPEQEGDSRVGKIELLEAKLDYAVSLLEKLSRK